MKLFISFLALAAATVAQQYDVRSPWFHLQILSRTNTTINGTLLQTCHEGAAQDAFCLTDLTLHDKRPLHRTYFTQATSTSSNDKAIGPIVYTWTAVGRPDPIDSSIRFVGTNGHPKGLLPLFMPGMWENPLQVGFDTEGKLFGQSWGKREYAWSICVIQYNYRYENLVWGLTTADEPTCTPIDVVRVWLH